MAHCQQANNRTRFSLSWSIRILFKIYLYRFFPPFSTLPIPYPVAFCFLTLIYQMKHLIPSWASLVSKMVKNLSAIEETQDQSLGWEDPLEEGMATHSSILAWKIPWTEQPCGLQSLGSQRVGHDWAINTHTHNKFISALHFKTPSSSILLWLSIIF